MDGPENAKHRQIVPPSGQSVSVFALAISLRNVSRLPALLPQRTYRSTSKYADTPVGQTRKPPFERQEIPPKTRMLLEVEMQLHETSWACQFDAVEKSSVEIVRFKMDKWLAESPHVVPVFLGTF